MVDTDALTTYKMACNEASALIPWSNTLISSLLIGSHPLQSTDRRGRPRRIGFAGFGIDIDMRQVRDLVSI